MALPAYATLDDLRDKDSTPPAWSYIDGYKSADDPLIGNLLLRASRIFDTIAQRAHGYFQAAAGVATQMVVVGDGTNYLRLPVYVPGTLGVTTVPSGYQVPTFSERTDENGQQWLVKSDAAGLQAPAYSFEYWQSPVGSPAGLGRGWPQGLPVTITAKWGYESTPEDVKEAVIELTVAMYRSKDLLVERLLELDKAPQLKAAVPPRVQAIADKYVVKRPVFIA